jgi:hypothetical protein
VREEVVEDEPPVAKSEPVKEDHLHEAEEELEQVEAEYDKVEADLESSGEQRSIIPPIPKFEELGERATGGAAPPPAETKDKLKCPNCGEEIQPDWKKCPMCETEL